MRRPWRDDGLGVARLAYGGVPVRLFAAIGWTCTIAFQYVEGRLLG